MGIDFDKIRNKLAQLSGQNKKRDAFWRPEQDQEYSVRIVPFLNNEGQPFKERKFYYGIGKNRGLLAPSQFGKEDPFQELINTLREEDSKESYELMKKLFPKMRAFAPVIVRGEEDKGPRLWSFGKTVYQQLLNIMIDEDFGDITSTTKGHDIKVKVTKQPGQQWAMTAVMPRPSKTPLSSDKAEVKKWMDEIPDLDAIYSLKSYDELSKIINDWLEGADEDSDGTERGNTYSKSSTPAVASSNDGEVSGKTHDNLDAAFNELMKDDG